MDINLEESVVLGGDKIEKVKRFCYLEDVLSAGGGAQAAVTARIRSAWRKFRDISNILCGRVLS